jgi:hypothetical protein
VVDTFPAKSMLAYIFWHWRQPAVPPDEYERRQREFHDVLRRAPSPGFVRSFTHAIAGAPWANAGGDAYEDWYLTTGSAALDPLNDAAVTAARQAPHDRAASVAAGGTAGLYRLRAGSETATPRHALWFAKPANMSYSQLFEALKPSLAHADAGLWLRQMTLGPATECCILADAPVTLPAPFEPRPLALREVWNGG